ncbi:hypothetical protein [Bradyrhizobium sp. CCBAU 51765]|uniref:hypothetical protein n=1 Tax=Bradyrhizobium sp. CCBAU 51765 TaxID=1325102 RepID=UPI001888F1DF|nr:hypothetical protein [Bradyrhizobium sp. CCBAU 51765]QOZ06903.1 hypothetical protein XH96_04750 [Bradyrhizobium sp. CCBAU 51765]
MTTVASRIFISTPGRDAMATWTAIVDLLTQGKNTAARNDLLAVSGVAASVIADHAPKSDAIVVTCDGPRTRIYCVYDDDAIEASDANEDALGFDPLSGNWRVSLPCLPDDLGWVQSALKKHSERITARALGDGIEKSDSGNAAAAAVLVFDQKGFMGS